MSTNYWNTEHWQDRLFQIARMAVVHPTMVNGRCRVEGKSTAVLAAMVLCADSCEEAAEIVQQSHISPGQDCVYW